jgi:biopolymer transport protein ExbD
MRIACLLIVALVACGDDGSEADSLFKKRETKREATRAEQELEATRREIERMQERMDQERRSGLEVNLPSGTSQEIDPAAMSLVIDITDDGVLVVAGKALDERDLEKVFRAAFVREPTTQVVIRAARGTSHGVVVRVMEQAKAAGLTRLAIGTTPAAP